MSKKLYADQGAIVEVHWIDSCGPHPGWTALEDLDLEPSVIRSAGIVMHSDKEAVTLILSHHPDGEMFDGAITIPQVAITDWKILWPAK